MHLQLEKDENGGAGQATNLYDLCGEISLQARKKHL